MPEYSLQVPWLAAPFLALVLVGWSTRWRWLGALVLGGVASGIGLWKGALIPSDAVVLLEHGGLGPALAQLSLWTLFAVLLRAGDRPVFRGPPLLIAPVMGACMGELGAAAILSSSARDPKAAARLALAAAGGGMLGRIGDPAILVLWDKGISPVVLGLLGLICVAIAAPKPEDMVERGPVDPVIAGTCIAVAGLAVFPGMVLQGLAVGCGVLLFQLRSGIRRVDPRPLCWMLGVSLTVLVALSGGVITLAGLGLEELQEIIGDRIMWALMGAGALMSTLCGGECASLLAESILSRRPGLQSDGLYTALAAGLAVGGLGPLVVAGALKEGLLRWGVQVLAVLGACALVLG